VTAALSLWFGLRCMPSRRWNMGGSPVLWTHSFGKPWECLDKLNSQFAVGLSLDTSHTFPVCRKLVG
jgi:hypothetical protein